MCNRAIEEFNNGNSKALNDIYKKIAKDIYIYGFVVMGNTLDGEQVLNDTMKKVSIEAYKYNPKRDGKIWIMSIAREVAKNLLKARELQNVVQDNEYIEMIHGNEAFVSSSAREQIDSLNIAQREVLALTYFKYSVKGIAKILKISKFKVKKLAKGVRKFTELIEALSTLNVPDEEGILKECNEPNNKKCVIYRRTKKIVRNSLIFACASVIIITSILVPRSYIMKEEYEHAVNFFVDNELSMDNMSKEKIVTVYKDIVNGEYKERKTRNLIKEKLDSICYDGEMVYLTPDTSAAKMWSYLSYNNKYEYKKKESKVEYICYDRIVNEEEYECIKGAVMKGYDDTVIWEVTFEDFLVHEYGGCVEWNDDVVVYGASGEGISVNPQYAYLALLDGNGNILWQLKLYEGYVYEEVIDIIVKDEKIIVFSQTLSGVVLLREVDKDGNIIKNNRIVIDDGIRQAVEYGDGYALLHKWDDIIFYVDIEGKYISQKSLDEEWDGLNIEYIATFIDKIYVSAYSSVNIYVYNEMIELQEMSDDEIMRIFRSLNTSYLWSADIIKDEYEKISYVKGSNGKNIEFDEDGNLVWNVLGFEEGKYVGSNGVTYDGEARYYQYVLDENNKLISKYKTYKKEEFSN